MGYFKELMTTNPDIREGLATPAEDLPRGPSCGSASTEGALGTPRWLAILWVPVSAKSLSLKAANAYLRMHGLWI